MAFDPGVLGGAGLAMGMLAVFIGAIHRLYGWDNVFGWLNRKEEGVVARTEPDPAHTVWHRLRDGRTARVEGEEVARIYKVEGLPEPIVVLRHYYECGGEHFSDCSIKGQLEPLNEEARLGLDGGLWGFRYDDKDTEINKLKKQLIESGNKLSVKNADFAEMYDDHSTHFKKVAEDHDYISRKMGKVTVSGRPLERRKTGESQYAPEDLEGVGE